MALRLSAEPKKGEPFGKFMDMHGHLAAFGNLNANTGIAPRRQKN